MESTRNIMLKLSSSDLALLIAGSQDLPASIQSQNPSSSTDVHTRPGPSSLPGKQHLHEGSQQQQQQLLKSHHQQLFSVTSGEGNDLSGSSVVWSDKHSANWLPKHSVDLESRWQQRTVSQTGSMTLPQTPYTSGSMVGSQSKASSSRSFPLQLVHVDGSSLTQGQGKNKVIPLFMSGDKLFQVQTSVASQLQSPVTGSDLPVDLRNVMIVPRVNQSIPSGVASQTSSVSMGKEMSQTLNQDGSLSVSQVGMASIAQEKVESRKVQFGFTGQNVHSLGSNLLQENNSAIGVVESALSVQKQPPVNSVAMASPVYKSKLEKAIAQNQHSANAQILASKATALSEATTSQSKLKTSSQTNKTEGVSSGTLKRLLSSSDDQYLQQLEQQQLIASQTHKQMLKTSKLKESVQQHSNDFLKVTPIHSTVETPVCYYSAPLLTSDTGTMSLAISDAITAIRQQDPLGSSSSNSLTYTSFYHPSVSPSHSQITSMYHQQTPVTGGLRATPSPSVSTSPSSSMINNYNIPMTLSSPPAMLPTSSIQPATSVLLPSVLSGVSAMVSEEMIREKEYNDDALGQHMMEGMWKLREMDMFCDALLLVAQQEIKLHRLVLSSICVEITKMAMKSTEPLLRLMLPSDITYANAMLFVSYIYHGRLTLNLDNVQQLYRLSAMFGMEQLSKHCYDFCKQAKCGHLIISSPYQEAVLQVPNASPIGKLLHNQEDNMSDAHILKMVSNDKSTLTCDASVQHELNNIDQIQMEAVSNQMKSNDEFDWLTSDPSQSNIPIRKRGRNRKGILTAARCEVKSITDSRRMVDESCSKVKSIGTEQEVLNSKDTFPRTKVSDLMEEHPQEKPTEMSDLEASSGVLVIDDRAEEDRTLPVKPTADISDTLAALPDPLASGKFDESELLRLTNIDMLTSARSHEEATKGYDHSVKTMATRFRARPKNMTVLEAAAHKKAKFYDTSGGMMQKKSPKPRFTRSPKNYKQMLSVSKDVYPLTSEALLEGNTSPLKDFSVHNEAAVSLDIAAVQSSGTLSEAATTDLTSLLEGKHSNVEPREEIQDMKTECDGAGDVSKPKRLRLRKSVGDEGPLKESTVYMRPPPKKRTKEIHEMMKNEQDISQSDTVSSFKLELLMSYADDQYKEMVEEDSSQMNIDKPLTGKGKRLKKKKIKDESLMQKVYEIESSGKDIDGDKQYRCLFCSNVFTFAKRAITHILNTHDVDLDEIGDCVFVELRTSEPKICDVCGYQSKDSMYYIHYHKYFKHGVPLPKGWTPFTCDLCKKEFFTKFQLRDHKLIHFEEHPFMCEHCGSGFKSRPCLNSHVFHKHSSVRRHKCSECTKSFKTRTQMKVHQRTHTGEKPFLCVVKDCSYRSTTRGNMRLHLVNRHKFVGDHVKDIMITLQQDNNSWQDGVDNDNIDREGEMSIVNGDLAMSLNKHHDISDDLHARQEAYVELAPTYTATTIGDQLVSGQDALTTGDFGMTSQNLILQQHDKDQSKRQDQTVIGQDMSENIPRHVQLLITNGNSMTESHNLLPSEAEHILSPEFSQPQQQQLHQPGSENVTVSRDFVPSVFDTPDNLVDIYGHQSSSTLKTKPVDPQSREARSLVKAVLHRTSQPSRSLLKNVLLNPSHENFALSESRSAVAGQGHFLNKASESKEAPIEMEEDLDPSQHTIISDHQQEQFRGGNSILYNSGTQRDGQDFSHLNQVVLSDGDQNFESTSVTPPPCYSSSSQSATSLNSFNNMSMAPTDQDHLEDQKGEGHLVHGKGVQTVDVHNQASASKGAAETGSSFQGSGAQQFNGVAVEGSMYQNYYDDQYEIENY